jgi:capsular exopolysaccharide synthesis family protein
LITDAEATQSVLAAGIFSGLPGEGKSMVTQELAKSFALINRRVIVVDGDMRLGSLSKNLGMASELPGLSEVLSTALDPADVIVPIKAHGFDLLPNGKSQDHPGDLLESAVLAELIQALRDRYDVILFDTPPILLLPDATKIASQLTTHVLVVDYDRSPRSAVKDAAMALQSAKATRPIVAFCSAPDAFGRNYIASDRAFARYWT